MARRLARLVVLFVVASALLGSPSCGGSGTSAPTCALSCGATGSTLRNFDAALSCGAGGSISCNYEYYSSGLISALRCTYANGRTFSCSGFVYNQFAQILSASCSGEGQTCSWSCPRGEATGQCR